MALSTPPCGGVEGAASRGGIAAGRGTVVTADGTVVEGNNPVQFKCQVWAGPPGEEAWTSDPKYVTTEIAAASGKTACRPKLLAGATAKVGGRKS